jgi:hypothetical protein
MWHLHRDSRRLLFAVGVICSAFFHVSSAFALPSQNERDSLKGLTSVYVVVSPLPDWVQSMGVTPQHLRNILALELDRAHIAVAKTYSETVPALVLAVKAQQIKGSQKGAYIVGCELGLLQTVQIKRNGVSSEVSGVSWQPSGDTAFEVISAMVKIQMQQFISDYETVNPSY